MTGITDLVTARRWLIASIIAVVAVLLILLLKTGSATVTATYASPLVPVTLERGSGEQTYCVAAQSIPTDAGRIEFATTELTDLSEVTLTIGGEPLPLRRTAASTSGRIAYALPSAAVGKPGGGSFCLIPRGPTTTLLGEGETVSFWLTRADNQRWLSGIGSFIERAGIGRGALGTAALPLAAVLIVAAWALAIAAFIAALKRPTAPLSRRAIAAIGVAASCWAMAFALTTPPFQAPDEMVHLHYVELLRTKHKLPTNGNAEPSGFSTQLRTAIEQLDTNVVSFRHWSRGPWSAEQGTKIDRAIAAAPLNDSRDSFTNASSQPPLYYLSALPLEAAVGGTILDRLLVTRLWSALLIGLAAACGVAFVRELLVGAGATALVGGAVLSSFPLIAFIGGSINPDAALLLTSAASLWALAVILRRGLTVRRGALFGLAVGAGLLSKLTFAGLAPGLACGLLLAACLTWRSGNHKQAIGGSVAACATVALLTLPYAIWAIASGRGLLVTEIVGPDVAQAAAPSLRHWLSFSKDLYLDGSNLVDIWGDGLTGQFGWLDYSFPHWVLPITMTLWALVIAAVVIRLLIRILRRSPGTARTALTFVVLGICCAGVMMMVSRATLTASLIGASFIQARYLFPLAAIGAAGIAYATGACGPLRRHISGSVIALGLLHGTAGWMLTVARYFS